jgi:hypothetical protein
MKLYNKSSLSDAALEPLLVAAGRCAHAKTSGVVVKVTHGRSASISGMAHSASFVYAWHLWRGGGRRRVDTHGGWFSIVMPRSGDSLAIAELFFKTAIHEWAHIRDYQAGGRWAMPWASKGPGGRRARHDSRPEELRAINAVDDALAAGALRRYQDLVIALCVEHERLCWADTTLADTFNAAQAKTSPIACREV